MSDTKKMKLSLDDLKVESFETTPGGEGEGQGTVFGYITQDLTICEECSGTPSCTPDCQPSNVPTCVATCGPTCGPTCAETCYACVTCPEYCGTFACWACTNRDC